MDRGDRGEEDCQHGRATGEGAPGTAAHPASARPRRANKRTVRHVPTPHQQKTTTPSTLTCVVATHTNVPVEQHCWLARGGQEEWAQEGNQGGFALGNTREPRMLARKKDVHRQHQSACAARRHCQLPPPPPPNTHTHHHHPTRTTTITPHTHRCRTPTPTHTYLLPGGPAQRRSTTCTAGSTRGTAPSGPSSEQERRKQGGRAKQAGSWVSRGTPGAHGRAAV